MLARSRLDLWHHALALLLALPFGCQSPRPYVPDASAGGAKDAAHDYSGGGGSFQPDGSSVTAGSGGTGGPGDGGTPDASLGTDAVGGSGGVAGSGGGGANAGSGGSGGSGTSAMGGSGAAGSGAGGTSSCAPAACNLPNATATCSSGECAVATCTSGYEDCTSSPGCETPITTVQNCGRCGKVCDVPVNGKATCVDGMCGFECIAPKVKCGTVCAECCSDGDCKAGQNETTSCLANRTCSFACTLDSSRCRGTCLVPKVLGACLVATAPPPLTLYSCDPRNGDQYLKYNATVPELITEDISDPDVVEKTCLSYSDDLTLAYCNGYDGSGGILATHAAARQARMDTVWVYTVTFDADGKLARIQNTANARSRTCMP